MNKGRNGESVEASARTLEDAISLGLARLGLSREEVEIEVLAEGSRGILGIGAQEARVRLTPRALPSMEEEPEDEEEEELEAAEAPQEEEPKPEPTPARVAQVGTEILQELTNRMGFRARVSPRGDRESEEVLLEITGQNLGPLIGRHGQTLRALEYISRLMVSHRLGRRAYFNVDVQGYWLKRERQLKELAQRTAREVIQTGEPVVLEPMPARDRRIIHLELKEHPHVTTQSSGEGEERRVTVLPRI